MIIHGDIKTKIILASNKYINNSDNEKCLMSNNDDFNLWIDEENLETMKNLGSPIQLKKLTAVLVFLDSALLKQKS